MNVDVQVANPIEKLVDTIVLVAHDRKARFVAIEEARLRYWIGDGWDDEDALPATVFEPIVKRLCVLLGVLAPGVFAKKNATTVTGKLRFRTSTPGREVYLLVQIARCESGLRALLELVDADEYARRREPRLPSEHPYRA
jgi:hypothetical protein